MKKFTKSVLSIAVGIIATGIALDEAGQGTFGSSVQKFAQKITRGYGV